MNDSLDPILQQEEQRRLRTQLAWRLVIAFTLVAGVLGALSWLDQGKDTRPQMTVAQSRDVRIAPRASLTASAPIASAPVASAPQASAPAAIASAPVSQAASAATPSAAPAQPVQSSTTHQPQLKTPIPPAPTKITPPSAPQLPPVREAVKPEPAIKPTIQTATKPTPPSSKQGHKAGTPAFRYPSPVATPNGYTVQAGVFLHSSNADKLLKQAQGAGVPAYLETRVQIGPFSNKVEAEAAIRKLRQAGIEPVLKGN